MQTFLRWLLRPILEEQARELRSKMARLKMCDQLTPKGYSDFVLTGRFPSDR